MDFGRTASHLVMGIRKCNWFEVKFTCQKKKKKKLQPCTSMITKAREQRCLINVKHNVIAYNEKRVTLCHLKTEIR